MPSDPSPTQPDAGRDVFAPDEVSDALIQLREARIDTLETALRAALEVMGVWLVRVEMIEGRPMVDIQDVEGAKRFYTTLAEALRHE
jgi:hypothetical protein